MTATTKSSTSTSCIDVKVEFAIGHGVAVHAETAAGDHQRATRITTAVIPRSEVAKVEAPQPDDPILDDTQRHPVERELMASVVST
ncbi:MAG: hypothetical protein R2755_23495 [Acidimicrobiales bacterium]